MKIEDHKNALKEHEENIKRCVKFGILENQRNIGFNVSQASIETFSIYLLKNGYVTSSVNFDHRIFKKTSKISTKIPYDFPKKSEILNVMKDIEEKRILICYGKRKSEADIKRMLELWDTIKSLAGEKNEGE